MKIQEFLKQQPDLDILFLGKFGSHLYGTNTETSDEDYKGVFLPTIEQCITNAIPKSISFHSGDDDSKNSVGDIDIEMYSLQFYLKLIQKGDTGGLDMLHTPLSHTLKSTEPWEFLQSNRSDFYTTNLSAFVGYCRTQASKYGVKGSRLSDARNVVEFLNRNVGVLKLGELWDNLPTGDHIHKLEANPDLKIDYPVYQVCGRKLQSTVGVAYARDVVQKFYESYGHRAKLAAENKGIDWKAVSHALRCAFQMKQVYRDGDIIFPLENAEFLLDVKNGNRDYSTEVAPLLESLMDEVETLSSESNYPKKVDINKYNKWLVKIYNLNGRG
ncbi:nucleotidyltransferase domain-containing protein [bacterium]|nr:nucleotidyltransferase domain-containing protein [bacterium]